MSENTLLATPAATAPIKYLDRAMATLRSLGLAAPQDNNAPAIALVSQLSTLDQGRVVAIARVLQQSGHFNAVMRDEISSAKVSDRYTEIIRAFDSIRDDASTMVEQVRDGRIDMGECLQNLWMKVTRGDIPSRFEKIRRTFLEVSRDSAEQLQRESRVLEMYGDFRLSIKDAEIQAHELLKLQEQALADAREALKQAQQRVESADPAADAADTAGAAHGGWHSPRTDRREEATRARLWRDGRSAGPFRCREATGRSALTARPDRAP